MRGRWIVLVLRLFVLFQRSIYFDICRRGAWWVWIRELSCSVSKYQTDRLFFRSVSCSLAISPGWSHQYQQRCTQAIWNQTFVGHWYVFFSSSSMSMLLLNYANDRHNLISYHQPKEFLPLPTIAPASSFHLNDVFSELAFQKSA